MTHAPQERRRFAYHPEVLAAGQTAYEEARGLGADDGEARDAALTARITKCDELIAAGAPEALEIL